MLEEYAARAQCSIACRHGIDPNRESNRANGTRAVRTRDWADDNRTLRRSLAGDYFGAANSLGRVAGVDYQLRLFHDLREVVIRMVGDDQGAIVLAQIL
jgi:hypothetical protein